MNRSRTIAFVAAVAAVVASVAVQQGAFASSSHKSQSSGSWHRKPPRAAEPTIADGIATFSRPARLTDLASACAATATDERPGAVVLLGGLKDRGASVTIA